MFVVLVDHYSDERWTWDGVYRWGNMQWHIGGHGLTKFLIENDMEKHSNVPLIRLNLKLDFTGQ